MSGLKHQRRRHSSLLSTCSVISNTFGQSSYNTLSVNLNHINQDPSSYQSLFTEEHVVVEVEEVFGEAGDAVKVCLDRRRAEGGEKRRRGGGDGGGSGG